MASMSDASPEDEPRESHALLPVVRRSAPALPAAIEVPFDVALGAAAALARPVVGVSSAVIRAVSPAARGAFGLFLHPPLVPRELSPGALAERLGDQGRRLRYAAGEDLTVAGGQTLDVVMPAVLDPVLDRVDITGIVLDRVDLERLVGAVLDGMDLTDVVLSRVDLQPIISSALDGMDLTSVVLEKVDLKAVIESALGSVDLTEIVTTQVDLAGIAEQVIDEVDLPEIIRESTTGVASEVVDVTRMSAVSGDELVSRWLDRVLLRRSKRMTQVANLDVDEMGQGVQIGDE
jgi:hypothetical protein